MIPTRMFDVQTPYARLVCCLLAIFAPACGDKETGGDNNNLNNAEPAVCGNGILEPGEQCDQGGQNSDAAPDACRTSCRLAHCGDGVTDALEQCDDGPANSDLISGACRRSCVTAACGDGVIDPGEACDDANATSDDGCDPQCAVEPAWQCVGQPSACDCLPYRHGASCAGCTVYVDQDPAITQRDGTAWDTAFATIQEGIDAAAGTESYCEVWVAAGTYRPWRLTPFDSLELASKVGVYGGFAGDEADRDSRDWVANPTTIDGQASLGSDSSVFHVIRAEQTLDATLDGFIITGGLASGDLHDGDGGGILVSGSGLHLTNLEITGNTARIRGGGIFAYASFVLVSGCVIHDNTAGEGGGGGIRAFNAGLGVTESVLANNMTSGSGGGVLCEQGTCELDRVELRDNGAQVRGGGVGAERSNMLIRDSLFVSNGAASIGGGGLSAFDNVTLVVNRTRFAANQAPAGGGINLVDSTAELTSCVIANNGANNGGAIHATDSDVALLNGTLYQNAATNDGHSIYSSWTPLGVVNSIILGLEPAFYSVGLAPLMEYSNYTGGTGTNFTADPQFVDAPSGNFALGVNSPCIDRGDDTRAPATDLLGNPRVEIAGMGTEGTWSDLGALEYQP